MWRRSLFRNLIIHYCALVFFFSFQILGDSAGASREHLQPLQPLELADARRDDTAQLHVGQISEAKRTENRKPQKCEHQPQQRGESCRSATAIARTWIEQSSDAGGGTRSQSSCRGWRRSPSRYPASAASAWRRPRGGIPL